MWVNGSFAHYISFLMKFWWYMHITNSTDDWRIGNAPITEWHLNQNTYIFLKRKSCNLTNQCKDFSSFDLELDLHGPKKKLFWLE